MAAIFRGSTQLLLAELTGVSEIPSRSTSVQNDDTANYAIEDMPDDVQTIVQKYGYDSNGNGFLDSQDDVEAATSKLTADATNNSETQEALQFVADQLRLAVTDPLIALRSAKSAATFTQIAELPGCEIAEAVQTLSNDDLKGAAIEEQLTILEALAECGAAQSKNTSILNILAATPRHRLADLVVALAERGLLKKLSENFAGEKKIALSEQLSWFLWKLPDAAAIVEAMHDIGVSEDFIGTLEVLESLAQDEGAFREEIAQLLLQKGIFSKLLPDSFGKIPVRNKTALMVAGMGELQTEDYRIQLDNLFERLPDGPTKAGLQKIVAEQL